MLIRLLTTNLEKIGENKEGELILKNLNSSMLRMMENCNPTYIFCTLFALLKKYKDDQKLPKLPGLLKVFNFAFISANLCCKVLLLAASS